MREITLPELRSACVKASDDRPGFVYNPNGTDSCYYAPKPDHHSDEKKVTGCLIGTGLTNLGVDVTELDISSYTGDAVGIDSLDATHILNRQGFTLTPLAVRWAGIAQDSQDTGQSWEAAIMNADLTVSEQENL
jgi:hypothetical protein